MSLSGSCTETIAYTAIDDWNSLPNNVKGIKSEDKFKDSLKKSLIEAARKADKSQFVYYQIVDIPYLI